MLCAEFYEDVRPKARAVLADNINNDVADVHTRTMHMHPEDTLSITAEREATVKWWGQNVVSSISHFEQIQQQLVEAV